MILLLSRLGAQRALAVLSLSIAYAFVSPVLAETRWTLEELKAKAQSASPILRESQAHLESIQGEKGKSRARFFPEVGVEGGWEGYQASSEKKNTSFGFLYARYNVFNGGRDRAQLLSRSSETDLAQYQLDQTRRELARSVERLFYELLYYQLATSIQEDARKLNEIQMEMARKKQRSGLTSQADVLEFTLRGQALESELLLLSQEQETALTQLRTVLGGEETKESSVQGSFRELRGSIPTLDVLLAHAEDRRLDLKVAKTDLEVREHAARASFGGFLPRIDLEADYGRVPFDRRELERANQAAAIVKLTLPLFSGFESVSERRQALAEEERANARLMRARLEARSEIESLIVKTASLKRRLELARETLSHAKSYFDATTAEYRRGVKNSPDLAGATERHFESRLKEITLKKELSLVLIELDQAVGGLN